MVELVTLQAVSYIMGNLGIFMAAVNAINILTGYYEGLGTLVKRICSTLGGLLYCLAAGLGCSGTRFPPIADELRVHHKAPRIFSETEYLYNELMKYMKEHPELAT